MVSINPNANIKAGAGARANANNNSNNSNNGMLEKTGELLHESDKIKVQNALVNFFREGYIKNITKGRPVSDIDILEHINAFLIKYGIKISGGFILKNMGMFTGDSGATSVDIDIYLPRIDHHDKVKRKDINLKIHKKLQDFFNVDRIGGKPAFKYFRINRINSRKADFFTKNGIYAVTKYSKTDPNAEMDLVQADKTTTPVAIIQRFDLTFCQNWYDGENLWSMDKKAVYKEDAGKLEDSYVPLYLDNNPVTLKRIRKYISRGFRVKYNDPTTGKLTEIHGEDIDRTLASLPGF